MPNETGNNKNNSNTNNLKNEFPNQGNFSASKNRNDMINSLRNNSQNMADTSQKSSGGRKSTDNPSDLSGKVKKEGLKKGLETAATAYGTPAAGKVAKAAMNTKLGNKVINAAANKPTFPGISLLPKIFKKNEEPEEDIEDGAKVSSEAEGAIPKKVIKKIFPFLTFGSLGCLLNMILIAIIVALILSPIFYIARLLSNVVDGVTGFWNNMVYFFRGCSDEQECDAKEETKFYEALKEIHDKYQGDPYYITLNTELITATLTYADPNAILEENENASNLINFKKSKGKISTLANHMAAQGIICTDADGNSSNYKEGESCPSGTTQTGTYYYVDEEKYRKYLEDSFIRKFYFDNKKTEEVDRKIPIVVNDIFARVEATKYLNNSNDPSNPSTASNAQVKIYSCDNTTLLTQVDLYSYIQGVLYDEAGLSNPDEYLKTMAIVSKNYLYSLNGAVPNEVKTEFSIRSCTANQEYCSVTEGCHKLADGRTVAPGPDANGNYFHPPLTDTNYIQKMNNAIDSTFSEFVIKDNKYVFTQYKGYGANCPNDWCGENNMYQPKAIEMARNGSKYTDIIAHFYSGSLERVFLVGFPIDMQNLNGSFRVSSEFGRRTAPTTGASTNHRGIDFAILEGNSIVSVADGVVVQTLLNSSWGCFIKIGHDSNGDGQFDFYTGYAHLLPKSNATSLTGKDKCDFKVSEGAVVKIGQQIGLSGGGTPPSGTSTGAHLHFEYYKGCATASKDPNTDCRANPRELISIP